MRKPVDHFVRICAEHLPLQPTIYEFGALQVDDRPDINLRNHFTELDYVGSDMREGPGVDIVLNLHDLSLETGTAGTVLCMDTLEHVEYPRKAMEEIHRVLRADGIAVISSVFNFPIHDYPHDYWRFTPEGFRSLLKEFEHSIVASYGESEVSPQTIVGVGFKTTPPDLAKFTGALEKWEKWYTAVCQDLSSRR